jgi:hypothetical protein
MVVIHCVHWLWRQEKTEWSVMNAVRFCPSTCVEGLRKYPITWTVWYSVYEARVGDIHCLYCICYQWMFPTGMTNCIFLFILSYFSLADDVTSFRICTMFPFPVSGLRFPVFCIFQESLSLIDWCSGTTRFWVWVLSIVTFPNG